MTHILSKQFHKKQSAFPLTAIQVSGATSLPVLNSSIQLFHQYGFITAFSILLVGNLLICLLALTIVQMTANTTKNTLDNVRDFLGPSGSWTVGLILIVSTIAYFVTQTNWTTETLLSLFPFKEGYQIDKFFQFGAIVGILSVILIIPGIGGLRWLATISFPVILAAFIGILIFVRKSNPILLSLPSSIGGLAIALGTSLSVAVDYPTFFQHSRSKKDSIFAVFAIQIITFLIGLGGLYLGKFIGPTEDLTGWGLVINGSFFVRILFLLVVLLSCLCVNAVNIYSASIAWELIAPGALLGKKEYAILGIALTTIFVLITGFFSMELLLTLTDIPLANLCIVLVFGYFGKLLVGNLRSFDKWICYFGWLVGSTITVIAGLQSEINLTFLVLGFLVSIISVLSMVVLRKLRGA